MPASLAALASIPEPVTHASAVIASLDACLMLGFGRLGAPQIKSLEALSATFSGTPLGAAVSQAITAIRRSELTEKPFVALAAARAALQGAQHDALLAQAIVALGGTACAEPVIEPAVQDDPSHHQVWFESTRQWLTEIAIAGFFQLGNEALMPFQATLEKIQEEPALARQGALLTGFWNELVNALPVTPGATLPSYRWADLWSRAMLISVRSPAVATHDDVTGEFRPLGAVLHEHAHLATLVVHGVLRAAGAARWVRATVSSYKVDVVQGAEIGALLSGRASTLLDAMGGGKSLKITKMSLSSTGDLLWDDKRAELGATFSPIDEVAQSFGGTATTPAVVATSLAVDRHPVQIARPVLLSEVSVRQTDGTTWIESAGVRLPLAATRLGWIGIDGDKLLAAKQIFGLLRFDAGVWSLQPLLLATGKTATVTGAVWAKSAAATKGQGPTLTILRERAGRLLRVKS